MICRFLLTLFLAASAFGQIPNLVAPVPNVQTVDNLSQMLARPAVSNVIYAVRGKAAAGDWGPIRMVRWDPNSVLATNTGTIFAVTNGGSGRWIVDWTDRDARVFGAQGYVSLEGPVPWIKRLESAAVGTGDFSFWIRFVVPTNTSQSVGLLSVNRSVDTDGGADSLNASLEVYRGSGTEWAVLIRGTNSSSASGTTLVEASKLSTVAATIDAYAGQTVDLVFTRSGTNVAVYLNGTGITGSFTISNPAGLAKSIGSGDSLDWTLGTTIANEWVFPQPITRFATWNSALTALQAASPSSTGSKVIDYTSITFPTISDQTANIQAAIDHATEIGGGHVKLPESHYRIDGTVRMKPDVVLIGQGRPAYPNNANRPSRVGSTVLVPWHGFVGTVIKAGRDDADAIPFLVKRQLSQVGNGYVSSRFMRGGVKDMAIDGTMAVAARAIWLDRIGSFDVDNFAWWHVPGFAVYGVANNGFQVRDSWGQTYRGIALRGASDGFINHTWIDGTRGPALWNSGNGIVIQGNAFEFAANPTTAPAFEFEGSFDAGTDTITATGHKFLTGDVIRFENQGGALPTGLSASTDYFVIRVDADSLKVSTVYIDEDINGGALNGTNVVNFTTSGTGTNYVTPGPSVGVLNAGDGNMIIGNNFRGNWDGNVRVETQNENIIIGNNANLAGYNNPDRTNGTIGAIMLVGTDRNKITDNRTDDRGNALASQYGIIADSGSTENYYSGNSFDVDYPYAFASTGNFWMDGEGAFFPYDGGTPRLYTPSFSSFTNPNPLDKTNTTTSLFTRDRNRVYWSADYSSTNWWYAPLLPSATTQWSWTGGGDGSMAQVNNGTGSALWNVSSTFASAQSFEQVNASTASQGWKTSTMRNAGTNSTTYAGVGAGFQIREDLVGGWYSTGAGNAHYALGSTEWLTVGAIAAGNGNTLFRVNVAPTNSTTRTAALDVHIPPATPNTSLRVYTAEAGSLQDVKRDSVSGVLYTGSLLLSGLSDGDKGDITVSGSGATWTIDADSVALGTDTTGNYVATLETNGAPGLLITGSGTEAAPVYIGLDLEAGSNISISTNGNKLQISASTGGSGSTNGTPVAVDGAVLTEANFSDGGDINFTASGTNVTGTVQANSVALSTDTTGVYVQTVQSVTGHLTASGNGSEGAVITLTFASQVDMGTNTSFELPNAAAPTVNVFGQIAGDNDLWAASRGAPVFYDGTASVALVGALVSDTPSNGQVPKWNTGGTITWENDNTSAGTAIAVQGTNKTELNIIASTSIVPTLSGTTNISFVLSNSFPTDWYAGGFLPLYAGVSNALTGDLHFKQGSDIRVPMWESGSEWNAVGMRAANGIWSVVSYNTNDFTVLETMIEVDPSLQSAGTNAVTIKNTGFNNLLSVEPNAIFDGDVEITGNLTAQTLTVGTSNNLAATTAFVQQEANAKAAYTMSWYTGAGDSPTDSTTYYGGGWDMAIGSSTTYNLNKVQIPKTGTLRAVYYKARVAGSLGSAENVAHYIRINDTTDAALATVQYTAENSVGSATGLSQAVTAGDYVALKVVTPAWSSNPTSVRWATILYIE